MNNPLAWLGEALRCKHGTLAAPEHSLARSAFESLEALQLLSPTTMATSAPCPACDQRHIEQVVRSGVAAAKRYYIYCPQRLRVPIDPVTLRRWRPNLSQLAILLRDELALQGQIRALAAERHFRLGFCRWGRARREVFLSVGSDTSHLSLTEQRRSLVLTLLPPVQRNCNSARSAAMVWLADVCSIEAGRLVFNTQLMVELLAELDDSQDDGNGNFNESLRAGIHRYARQAVERVESEGTTRQLVISFARQGLSSRKIEQAMRERGISISHSKVARQIKHVKHLLFANSSASIVRDRLSQPCDSKGRPLGTAQPKLD